MMKLIFAFSFGFLVSTIAFASDTCKAKCLSTKTSISGSLLVKDVKDVEIDAFKELESNCKKSGGVLIKNSAKDIRGLPNVVPSGPWTAQTVLAGSVTATAQNSCTSGDCKAFCTISSSYTTNLEPIIDEVNSVSNQGIEILKAKCKLEGGALVKDFGANFEGAVEWSVASTKENSCANDNASEETGGAEAVERSMAK